MIKINSSFVNFWLCLIFKHKPITYLIEINFLTVYLSKPGPRQRGSELQPYSFSRDSVVIQLRFFGLCLFRKWL